MSTAWWVCAATRIWACGSRSRAWLTISQIAVVLPVPGGSLHDQQLVGFACGCDDLLLAVVEVQVAEPLRPARGRGFRERRVGDQCSQALVALGFPQRPCFPLDLLIRFVAVDRQPQGFSSWAFR